MRDQFAGDISDLLKFSFLRSLAGPGAQLGIAWYFVEGLNGRNDGRHREFCTEEKWKNLDEHVWKTLCRLKDLTVKGLEESGVLPPETVFYRAPVPKRADRAGWASIMQRKLATCDLVFLDPDNGLGKSTPRHATIEELKRFCEGSRAIAFIQFPAVETTRNRPKDFISN